MMTYFGIKGSAVLIWLIIAIVFVVIEALTVGLTTIWFAAGALVALVLALLNVSVPVQIIVFLIVSIVLLATTRKVFVNKLKTGSEKTNVDALVGEEGVVLKKIEPLEPGRVRLGGQDWAAISADKTETIEKDAVVKVEAVEGVKLIVRKL